MFTYLLKNLCFIILEVSLIGNLQSAMNKLLLFLTFYNQIEGKGQNYENHNVENQKELRKLRRRSEHRKD